MPVITARVSEDLLGDVQMVEKDEHTDRAETVRKLLSEAIREWKTKKALELLKDHKITYRKASKIAGITYPEILRLAYSSGIDIGYTLEDLKKDSQG